MEKCHKSDLPPAENPARPDSFYEKSILREEIRLYDSRIVNYVFFGHLVENSKKFLKIFLVMCGRIEEEIKRK